MLKPPVAAYEVFTGQELEGDSLFDFLEENGYDPRNTHVPLLRHSSNLPIGYYNKAKSESRSTRWAANVTSFLWNVEQNIEEWRENLGLSKI
jgi:hypothetical protein